MFTDERDFHLTEEKSFFCWIILNKKKCVFRTINRCTIQINSIFALILSLNFATNKYFFLLFSEVEVDRNSIWKNNNNMVGPIRPNSPSTLTIVCKYFNKDLFIFYKLFWYILKIWKKQKFWAKNMTKIPETHCDKNRYTCVFFRRVFFRLSTRMMEDFRTGDFCCLTNQWIVINEVTNQPFTYLINEWLKNFG